jgi:hypothetical protein
MHAWDTFYNVLPASAELRDEAGLRRYRELLEKGWKVLPSLAPSNEFRRSSWVMVCPEMV